VPTPQHILEAEAQARIISKLNQRLRDLEEAYQRANTAALTYKDGYDFYMLIQKACAESPVVAGEFQRFLMTCKLVEEGEDGTPGLTTEPDRNHAIQYGFPF
jgi:hypothetical protein